MFWVVFNFLKFEDQFNILRDIVNQDAKPLKWTTDAEFWVNSIEYYKSPSSANE